MVAIVTYGFLWLSFPKPNKHPMYDHANCRTCHLFHLGATSLASSIQKNLFSMKTIEYISEDPQQRTLKTIQEWGWGDGENRNNHWHNKTNSTERSLCKAFTYTRPLNTVRDALKLLARLPSFRICSLINCGVACTCPLPTTLIVPSPGITNKIATLAALTTSRQATSLAQGVSDLG